MRVAVLVILALCATLSHAKMDMEEDQTLNTAMLSMMETKVEAGLNPVPEHAVGMWKDGVEYVDNLGNVGQIEASAVLTPELIEGNTAATVEGSSLLETASSSTSYPSLIQADGQTDQDAQMNSAIEAGILARAGGTIGLENAGIWQEMGGGDKVKSGGQKVKKVSSSVYHGLMKNAAKMGSKILDFASSIAGKSVFAKLAGSAGVYFNTYTRAKFARHNLDAGLEADHKAMIAAMIEDCGGCMFVMNQVNMDVGQARLRKTIFDSIIANCRDAQSTPIFFSACQMMYQSIDSIAIDYSNGRNTGDVCMNARICT